MLFRSAFTLSLLGLLKFRLQKADAAFDALSEAAHAGETVATLERIDA